MFILGFELSLEGIVAEGDPQRLVNRVMTQVNFDVLEFWHAAILKRHFQRGADVRYRYQSRSANTTKIQWGLYRAGKTLSPGRPLVRSGALRERVRGYASIRAYPTRAIATMHSPFYAGMQPYRTGLPNLGAEITEVTDEEQDEIGRFATARADLLLQQQRGHRRRRL